MNIEDVLEQMRDTNTRSPLHVRLAWADEIERLHEQVQDMIEASGQECGCGYDKPNDVCLGHWPAYKKQQDEIEQWRTTSQNLLEQMLDEVKQNQRLREALQPFAVIEVPHGADSGTWVARTLHCNNQVTAMQVWKARAALAPDPAA